MEDRLSAYLDFRPWLIVWILDPFLLEYVSFNHLYFWGAIIRITIKAVGATTGLKLTNKRGAIVIVRHAEVAVAFLYSYKIYRLTLMLISFTLFFIDHI